MSGITSVRKRRGGKQPSEGEDFSYAPGCYDPHKNIIWFIGSNKEKKIVKIGSPYIGFVKHSGKTVNLT